MATHTHMDTAEAITRRRAVKAFDPDHEMPEDDLKTLLELTQHAPTAFNIQNWRFVVVRDPDLRQRIRAAANDQAQVTDASVLIIMCADLKAWAEDTERYWRKAPEALQEQMPDMIREFYRGDPQLQRDEAMRSTGIAAQTLMLAATAMGYQTCPMDGFDFEAVGELINLPDDHVISMFVALGKGTEPDWPTPGELPEAEVVIHDRF